MYKKFDKNGKYFCCCFRYYLCVVYIEEVILDNFIINLIILIFTAYCLKEKRIWYRLALSSIFGTVFAVFLPFINNGLIFYKLGALFCTTIFAIKYNSVKKYIFFVLTFSVISFSLGGAVYGLYNLFIRNDMLSYPQRKAVKYALFASIFILLGFSRQIGRFALKTRILALNEGVADVFIKDKCLKVKCFNDTGNILTDNVTLKPVLLLSRDACAHYAVACASARTLRIKTVTGCDNLPVIICDKFILHTDSGQITYTDLPIAVSKRNFNGYDLIYNAEALRLQH